jgi:hypothetical protein
LHQGHFWLLLSVGLGEKLGEGAAKQKKKRPGNGENAIPGKLKLNKNSGRGGGRFFGVTHNRSVVSRFCSPPTIFPGLQFGRGLLTGLRWDFCSVRKNPRLSNKGPEISIFVFFFQPMD